MASFSLRKTIFPFTVTALAAAAILHTVFPSNSALSDPTTAASQPAGPKLTYSSPDMCKTPVGNIQFHGPFTNETLIVATEPLDPHDFIEITCDLLILHTWDGSVEKNPEGMKESVGPDYLRMALQEGPTLLYTTFSNRPDNPGFIAEARYQNYPSQVPGEHLDPKTGAFASNTMGYNYPWGGAPEAFPVDATYRLKFIIPHSDKTATLHFTGMGLQNIVDESWGITNLKIRPLAAAAVKTPTDTEIAKAFHDALDAQGTNQPEAFQSLISGMDVTAAWVKRNVKPQPLDGARVAELLKNMAGDDTQIKSRDAAESELLEMGPAVEAYLRDARRTAPGEVRFRLDRALQRLGVTQIDDEDVRRVVLAARVLEIIATPKALEVRKSLTEK